VEKLPNCSTCEKVDEECTEEQVKACLRKSECMYCDNTRYHHPYGKDESRHCTNCGAEWSVWK
jgi:hypothetical protein